MDANVIIAVLGVVIVAGLATFAAHVMWMLSQPAPKPAGAARVNFGVLHAASAGAWLLGAVAIGLALLILPTSTRTLHAAAAYGVLGLVGFLAQMVVAMETRLLPMVTWFWAYAQSGYRIAPPSPHAMRDRSLQAMVFGGWTIGVPALAMGMFVESAPLVSLGAWALFAAVALATLDNVMVVAHAFRGRRSATQPEGAESAAGAASVLRL